MADVASNLAQKVPLLTRENWPVWSERMALLLRLQSCWSAVKPQSETPSASESTADSAATPAVSPEVDTKALAHIGLHVSDEFLPHVSKATSASELWSTLEAMFVSRVAAQKLTLKRQLTSLKQREYEPFEEYYARALELRRRLASIRVEITDDDLATTLLAGVGKDYVHTAEALSATTDELDLEVIRVKMITAEDRLGILCKQQSRDDRDGKGHALKAQAQFQRKCWNCGKGGHIATKCRNPKKTCSLCGRTGHLEQFCRQSATNRGRAEVTFAL